MREALEELPSNPQIPPLHESSGHADVVILLVIAEEEKVLDSCLGKLEDTEWVSQATGKCLPFNGHYKDSIIENAK